MNSPIAESGFGWGSFNSGLDSVLNIWGKVEAIKAQKAASGADMQQAKYQPELENGASIQVEAPQVNPNAVNNDEKTVTVGGVKMNKGLLMATGGILGLLVTLKALKII